MPITIVVQNYCQSKRPLPTVIELEHWVNSAYQFNYPVDDYHHELTVVIVSLAESARLNEQYRQKKGPTNILSFDYPPPPAENNPLLLGDLVVCAELVAKEANDQNKSCNSHWAHLIVHGVLHLIGFNHDNDKEAVLMEQREVEILSSLGYDNPYAEWFHLQ